MPQGAKVIIRGKGSLKEGQTRDDDIGHDEPMPSLLQLLVSCALRRKFLSTRAATLCDCNEL